MQTWIWGTGPLGTGHPTLGERWSLSRLFGRQASKSMCVCVHVCAYMRVCVHECICVHACVYVCAHVRIYVYAYMCVGGRTGPHPCRVCPLIPVAIMGGGEPGSQEGSWGPALDPGSQPWRRFYGFYGEGFMPERNGALSICPLHPGHCKLDLVQIALYHTTPYPEKSLPFRDFLFILQFYGHLAKWP